MASGSDEDNNGSNNKLAHAKLKMRPHPLGHLLLPFHRQFTPSITVSQQMRAYTIGCMPVHCACVSACGACVNVLACLRVRFV